MLRRYLTREQGGKALEPACLLLCSSVPGHPLVLLACDDALGGTWQLSRRGWQTLADDVQQWRHARESLTT